MGSPVRSPKVTQVQAWIDHEAMAILRESATGRKAYGSFLSRLLHEHRARTETRREMRGQGYHVQDALAEK